MGVVRRRLGDISDLALVMSLAVPAQPAWAETIQDQRWYLDTLHVEEAHQITQGEGITVAVVDTGVGECDDLDGHGTAMLESSRAPGPTMITSSASHLKPQSCPFPSVPQGT